MIEPFQSLFLLFSCAIIATVILGAIAIAFEAAMERFTRPKP